MGSNLTLWNAGGTVAFATDSATSTVGVTADNITIAPNKDQPITIRMRYVRSGGSNTVQSQYRVMAPASMAVTGAGASL